MTKDLERLNELAANEAFVAEFKTVETDEAYIDLLGRYGVEVTAEELAEGIAEAQAILDAQEGELNEEDLEQVAGGFNPGISGFGLTVGYLGLAAMMTVGGPVAIGAWAGGSLIAIIGLGAPSSKKKNKKKSKR